MLSIETERILQNSMECAELSRKINHFFKVTLTEIVPSLTCGNTVLILSTRLSYILTSDLPTSCGKEVTMLVLTCDYGGVLHILKAPEAHKHRRHVNPFSHHLPGLIRSFSSHFSSAGRG